MHFSPRSMAACSQGFRTLLRSAQLRRLDPRDHRGGGGDAAQNLSAIYSGRCADFVDGHQHVQLYPQVRDGFLAAVKAHAPDAWVRQARRNQPLAQRLKFAQSPVSRLSEHAIPPPRVAGRHRL